VYNAAAQTLDIYVNGVLDNGVLSGTVPSTQSNANVNANIGRRAPDAWGGYYFNGVIDDARIYNRALTQAEIQTDMNTPVGGQTIPTGTFSATPDSLPSGGGTVTLDWSSTGADSARISPGVGYVLLTGTRQVTVGATTTFVLTLVNQAGNRQYNTTVNVALPGGQGQQDITAQGVPIALITNPTGGGNHDIEVIRDGLTPPVGNTNPALQYDTFNGGGARPLDWIGYSFPSQHTFSEVTFQEGMHFSDGGWFTSIMVQVRVNGTWTDVQNFQSTPAYAGGNGVNYETYQLTFTPVAGDGIRIAGTPGGSASFISVGELRAFNNGSTTVPPPPTKPRDYLLAQNYPNPFNPSTKIGFNLPVGTNVSLRVYNMLGEEVAALVDGYVEAGRYVLDFSADRLANGIYLYRLKTDKYSEMRKMVLLR
jgi:hypothetical protein